MKNRRGVYASLLVGLATATVFALAPSATAYDPTEFPFAVDAMNTYSSDNLSAPPNDGNHDIAVGGGQHGDGFFPDCKNGAGTSAPAPASTRGSRRRAAHRARTRKATSRRRSRRRVPSSYAGPSSAWTFREPGVHAGPSDSGRDGRGLPTEPHVPARGMDNGNPMMGTPPDFIRNYGPDDFLPAENPLAILAGFPCGMPIADSPAQLQKGNITVRDVS